MDRKPVWINGSLVHVLPWAKWWDALLAAPEEDFRDVWTGRARLVDQYGRIVPPDVEVRSGQKITVARDGQEMPLIPRPLAGRRTASS